MQGNQECSNFYCVMIVEEIICENGMENIGNEKRRESRRSTPIGKARLRNSDLRIEDQNLT